MMADPIATAATIAAVYAALHASHQVADHWVQTSHQAAIKGRPGWRGQLGCARHIATYTAVNLAALAALMAVAGLALSPGRIACGLGVSAVTHYFADRRAPLRRVAQLIGSDGYFQHNAKPNPDGTWQYGPGTGAFELDQAWHIGWLFAAALIIGS